MVIPFIAIPLDLKTNASMTVGVVVDIYKK